MSGTARIAVLASGGDAPGMNACIRAVVRCAIASGAEAWGVEQGYEGLLASEFRQMSLGSVGGILDRGGTVLGTSRSPKFQTPEGTAQAAEALASAGVTGLVVVGGEGSMRGAKALADLGVSVVGVPATIDNDLCETDISIGFDTALNTICDAIAKIRDTASSHERTFVIEVMGRTSGFLALHSGLAGGADVIIVPEFPWSIGEVIKEIARGIARGKKHSIIVVAEGGAHAMTLATDLSERGQISRGTVLGHIQRGGSPSAFDRVLASRMGEAAVDALLDHDSGVMIGLCNGAMERRDLEATYCTPHRIRKDLFDLATRLAQ